LVVIGGKADIDENNPDRLIDIFVDELDLGELGFGGVAPEVTGRPAYHPSVLLKLYIYGYLNRVQSSRRLKREALRNVEVMWLTSRLIGAILQGRPASGA
jgi:transposase